MNANDHDSMHELLCAYILGETSQEQTLEIETALAASAELRAQRVELEQTIGLVKQGLGDNMSLSGEAMSSLLAAATSGQTVPVESARPWYASHVLRAAAGIVMALGGVLGVLALRDQFMSEATVDVARSDAPMPATVETDRYRARLFDEAVVGRAATEVPEGAEAGIKEAGQAEDGLTASGSLETLGMPVPTGGGGGAQGQSPSGPAAPGAAAPVMRPAQAQSSGRTPGTERRPSINPVETSTGSDHFYGRAGVNSSVVKGLERNLQELEADLTDDVPLAEGGALYLGGGEEGKTKRRAEAGETASRELADGRMATAGNPRVAREPAFKVGSQLEALGYLGVVEAEVSAKGRRLSVDELQELADRHFQRIYRECRRRPGESPRDMFFRFWGDNSFVVTQQDRLSTFAADVDTASYALARRYLEERRLPTKAQIRTEEFVNYAKPDLPTPTEGALAIHTELAPSLFGGKEGRLMLRVGIRGQEVSASERKPLSLTFAIDVSGSMEEGQRLELVKHAIRLLVGQLNEGDKVGLVAYSREARMVLPMTDASERGLIESALHPLSPNGGTNAEAGLKMAYELALTALDSAAHSRVILLSDGVANIGTTDQDRINRDVTRHRDAGIYLNTIGVGMNNHNDVFLEQLANKGDGICDYVDDEAAARRAIVERFTGALIPIAGDVKIQVEFDPAQVHSYRLLGYENRAVADADFRNDAVDAGEIGAGHQVVALYELDRVSGESSVIHRSSERTFVAQSPKAEEGPLATIRLRWKAPKAAHQHPLEVEVTETSAVVELEGMQQSFAEASAGYRRSVLTAQLAEFLRRSSHARGDSFRVLDDQTARLAKEEGDEDSHELANLVKRTMALGLPLQLLDRSGVDLALDEYQRYLYMRAQLDDLERLQQGRSDRELKDLEDRNSDLEQSLRERIYIDLQEKNG
ncbi:MAG: von Willebrand factor type A domain-containing protein [Planctomycetota bacterium]|nr:von Willebrand factor type A domain-containing protein [Planctomycetota bacterium]